MTADRGRVNDALGARMKGDYEFRARTMLPRRTWTVVRLDGRNFHSYTRGLDKPFDAQLVDDMAATAAALCAEVSGCRLAYTQSDEISLILSDTATASTQAWFDGNQQKIVSITAALATAVFNERRPGKRALFDSRAFTIPDLDEVINYLIWRQQDAVRNSIQMAGQAHFSHRELHLKSTGQIQEMLWSTHGVNWNDYPPAFRRGTVVAPLVRRGSVSYVHKRTGKTCTTDEVERRVWETAAAPTFTKSQARGWVLEALAGQPGGAIPDTDMREEQ